MTTSAVTGLAAQAVVSLEQAHEVAYVRNRCTGTFTHHNEFITADEQRAWWESKPNVRAWLYKFDEPSMPRLVGFGLLRPDEQREMWATLGVLPESRGRGYGTAIYRHLIAQAEQVWIEIGANNAASYKAAHKAGFVPIGPQGKVLTLVATRGTT